MAKLDVLNATTTLAALNPRALPSVEVSSLYLHIPFCFHKCHYCDFYSITRQTPDRMARFVDLILRELDGWLEARQQAIRPRTIFFGGGTPSLLPIGSMRQLLTGLATRLDLSGLCEWTVEVNPATADLAYLQMMRGLGVNRISSGAQSFVPAELATLERHHAPPDVERSVALCREAGYRSINIDLIYAIPGQTLESWELSLRRAIELGLEHYSCYNLTYEPNTPMAVKQRLGRLVEVDESTELAMLRHAREVLEQIGCPPYEVSNYAAPGHECLHNLAYWRGESYLGIGPSAASHIEGVRFKNRPHLGEWEAAVAEGTLPAIDVERLSAEQREGEYMMLGLRLAVGVSMAEFEKKFGKRLADRFSGPLEQLSTLGLITINDDRVRLSKKGLPVADAVAAEFL